MVFVLYLPAVLWAFALQTSPSMRALGPGWHIDFALLVVVAFALLWGGRQALFIGFITGLIHDALSSDLFGLNTVIKSLAGFAVVALPSHALSHNVVTQGLVAGLAIGLDTLIRLVILSVLHARPLPLTDALRLMIPHVLLGMMAMPWICKGLLVLARALRLPRERGRHDVAS